MELAKIVQGVNIRLAGEMLTYDMLKNFLDSTVDDINERLNSTFPVFSEFTALMYPNSYPNYNFIPDRFIRQVIITGAAYKYYVTDEEGLMTAQQYSYDYKDALFILERDFSDKVPEEFQADFTGSVLSSGEPSTPFNFQVW